MKDKPNSMFQTGRTGISVLNFPSLGFIWLRFVSDPSTRLRTRFDIRICFEFRYSNFGFFGAI